MKRILLGIILFLFCVAVLPAEAQADSTEDGPTLQGASSSANGPDLVEITYPLDTLVSYRERRRRSGWNLGVHVEEYVPKGWVSSFDQKFYTDNFGSTPIDLIKLEAGYKYNFELGSLSALVGMGYGQAKAAFADGDDILVATKPYLRAMYIMDNITAEPWVAPYIAGSVWTMQFKESFQGNDVGTAAWSGMGFDYTVGLLLQLNWIEPDLSRDSLNTLGLQNTYFDIFATQYMRSQGPTDLDTSSDFILGAGLRLEF